MRYLILYGAGIGDFVSLLPLAQQIKKNDPNAYIVCFNVSNKNKININRELLSVQQYIDGIEYYSVKEFFHSIRFILKYLINRFDYAIMVQHEDNDSASLWPYYICKCICKKIVGYEMKNRKKIKFDITLPRNNKALFVDVYLHLGHLIGIKDCKVDFPLLRIPNDRIIHASVDNIRYADIVLCVGTGKIGMRLDGQRVTIDAKTWGYNNWVKLANELVKLKYSVALLGGKKEKEEIESGDIIELCEEVMNYCGEFSITDSLIYLKKSRLVIGADTGLMHCAAAFCIPSITLFGCTSHNQYLPYGPKSRYINKQLPCSPCFGTMNACTCKDRKCMSQIRVDEVIYFINDVLKNEEDE